MWPEIRPGRFAAAIYRNSTELLDSPDALRAMAAKCRVGLIGLTDDSGVELNHGRTGAREGPHAFRRALAGYGVASPMPAAEGPAGSVSGPTPPPSHPLPHVFDTGDIIPGRDLNETHDRVTAATAAMLDLGLFPIAIGGGHDLTFPFVRAVAKRALAARRPPLRGVYLDAHLDVRPEPGSGMPFRSLIDGGFVSELTCIGVNPLVNTSEHYRWFQAHGGTVEAFEPTAWPGGSAAGGQFVSLDLDVLDSAFAPGVSALNPCGMTPARAAQYAYAAGQATAVECFDIMEFNPRFDQDGRTGRLAAHLFLVFLRGLAARPVVTGRALA